MRDPVVAADGHTYERSAIARWLATSDKSPLTGSILPHKNLVPNYMLVSSLQEAQQSHNDKNNNSTIFDDENNDPSPQEEGNCDEREDAQDIILPTIGSMQSLEDEEF